MKDWTYIKVPYYMFSYKVPVASGRIFAPIDIVEIELRCFPGGINIGMNEEHKILVYAVKGE